MIEKTQLQQQPDESSCMRSEVVRTEAEEIRIFDKNIMIYSEKLSFLSKELYVYYMDNSVLNDDGLFEICLGQISEFRREKVKRFKKRKSMNQSLGASILLYYGLQKYGLCEKNMKYRNGENGKPYFASESNENGSIPYFSISHSGDISLAAFSNVEIGCDVERIAEYKSGIPERFFCADEQEYIRTGTVAAVREAGDAITNTVPERFYSIWTRKESYLKLTGDGLRRKLSSFSVLNMDGIYFLEPNGIPGYAMCCCI